MQVPMAKIRVLGHRSALDPTLAVLHRSRRVHLVDVGSDPTVTLPPLAVDDEHLHRIEDLRYLRARLDGLLRLVPSASVPPPEEADPDMDLDTVRAEVEEAGPKIEELVTRIDGLRAELETLPRHLESLRRLLPLLPDMSELEAYETTALLLDARHGAVLAELNDRLTENLGGNFELISDRVDPQTIGAVLIYPRRAADRVQREFGREQVTRVRLPERYESVGFRHAIGAMERRLEELPVEIENAEDAAADVVRAHPHWPEARAAVQARLDQLSAIRRLGATPHTFVLSGWVPEDDVPVLRAALERLVGADVILETVETGPDDVPPVLLRNPPTVAAFESFVRLLDIPRPGTIDPSLLMTVFLPLFFGMMLGDIAYGAILLVVVLLLRRRFRTPGYIRDLTRILLLGAGWSIVWGFLYGEMLGDLGHRLGLEPIWINREEAVQSLLLFSVAVGAAHIVLGLVLGIWQARRGRDRHKLVERVGMLLSLIALFAIAGGAAGMLPAGVVTPAVAVTMVGLVLVVSSGGLMGLLMGPLEFVGTIGNVLSYLRIAAIGLASVYLARIANELGAAAPLWLGIAIAALFHALNLVLGVFSPTIQALRLHYVEFFGKFFEGGGKPFRPFGEEDTTSRRPVSQR
jgi:V/A-type H+-transporting ATPase subunit I